MAIKYYNTSFERSTEILDNESVDMFFLDPPYYISGGKNKTMNLETGDRQDWDKQWETKEEYREWTKTYLQLAYNQLKPNGSIYVCIQWQTSNIVQDVLEEIGFHIQNRITWKRDKGRGAKSNWKSIHEDIFFATKHKKNYTFNVEDVMVKKEVIAPYRNEDGTPKDWWEDENGNKVRMTYPGNLWNEFCVPYWSMNEVKSYAKTKKTPDNTLEKHNTQKPKDLVKKCIIASSNEGDLIVDYFSGSGTTAIASEETKRNSIVFDLNTVCIDMLKTRMNNELKPEKVENDK
jgi:site-specific DNA-methyltransferase (adenine-specific)